MGSLVIDIETASPFKEPPDGVNDTEYFEWFSVATAYINEDEELATSVHFRRGGWEDRYTADLLDRLVGWCKGREIERTLTYYGSSFDLKHMANWAEALEESGERPGALADLKEVLPRHVDVAKAVADRYPEEVREGREVIPDWKAYELEGIDNDGVWYEDYDFNTDYWQSLGIESKVVQGKHIGQTLGQKYVEGVTAGLEQTSTHRELKRLLYDYSLSDVVDLFTLYEAIGGETLDEEYHFPIEKIDR